ncbi:MAG: alpha/beta hydrolase [Bacteroidota bacterium]|nr:alpha/beta hydrolase [Bacteroidota bacterium]
MFLQFQSKEVFVNDIKIHVEFKSNQSSKNILFIHGLSNSSLVWHPLVSDLNADANYYMIDLPGCGQSQARMYDYDKAFYINIIEGVCKSLDLQNIILVGHSMGGQIATHVALNEELGIKKLVLLSSAGFEQYHFHERKMFEFAGVGMDFFKGGHSYLSQVLHQSFYNLTNENKEVLDKILMQFRNVDPQTYQHMLSQSIKYMCENDLLEATCKVPTLLVFGKNDEMIPNRMLHPFLTLKHIAEDCAKIFQTNKLEMLEQCGHFIHVEKYKEVANLMRLFLLS